MSGPPIRVWTGEKDTKKLLIACRSERRAAEIVGVPIIKLREWTMDTPYAPWMEIGKIYQYHEKSGVWEEA